MDIIKSLRKKQKQLLDEARKIQQAIGLLGGKAVGKKRTSKRSAASRRRMSLAAKRRWKARKAKQKAD